MPKTRSVAAIKEGTVIDHIPPGQAFILLQLLKLFLGKNLVSLGLNLSSTSLGLKDLIKIENRYLTEKETHDIAVFAPKATISIIKNYQVTKKITATLPPKIERILVCPNPRCITNCEKTSTLFLVESHQQKIFVRCHFCEKSFNRDEIKDYRP
jgi:aspartate carbamoyltransferase regulatory subunit